VAQAPVRDGACQRGAFLGVTRRPNCFALLTFPSTFLQRLGGLAVCEFGTPHEGATRSFAEQMQLASHARAVALCGPDFMVLLQCTAGCGTAA
jgi:hypothetical protein